MWMGVASCIVCAMYSTSTPKNRVLEAMMAQITRSKRSEWK